MEIASLREKPHCADAKHDLKKKSSFGLLHLCNPECCPSPRFSPAVNRAVCSRVAEAGAAQQELQVRVAAWAREVRVLHIEGDTHQDLATHRGRILTIYSRCVKKCLIDKI